MKPPFENNEDVGEYDVFIAYAHADGARYAAQLATKLRVNHVVCFLDREGFLPGDNLTEATERALRRSRHLLLICTPGAFASPYVEREVTTYAGIRHSLFPAAVGRPIIPIDVGNAATDAGGKSGATARAIANAIRLPEATSALELGPSPRTIEEIQRRLQGTRALANARRKRRLRTSLFATLIGAAIVIGVVARTRGARVTAENLLRQAEVQLRAGVLDSAIRLAVAAWEQWPSDEPQNLARAVLDRSPVLMARVHHGDTVDALALSADGSRLVSVGLARARVRGWNAATGDSLWSLPIGPRATGAVFSQNGGTLAVTYAAERSDLYEDEKASRIVRVWDVFHGKELPALVHAHSVHSVASSVDGRFIATASDDSAMLWSVDSGARVFATGVSCRRCAVAAVALSGDARYFAWVFTRDSTRYQLRILDRRNARRIIHSNARDDSLPAPSSVTFDSRWHRLIYVTGADLLTYDFARSGQWLERLPIHATTIGLLRAGEIGEPFEPVYAALATSAPRNVRIYVARLTPGGFVENPELQLQHVSDVTRIVVLDDSATILTATKGGAAHVWIPDSVGFRETARLDVQGHVRALAGIRRSDTRYVAVAGADSTVNVWRLPVRGTTVQTAEGASVALSSVSMSPNSKFVAALSASPDELRVWDAGTLRLVAHVAANWHGLPPTLHEVTDDGRRVVFQPLADAPWEWLTADTVLRRWGSDTTVTSAHRACSGSAPARTVTADEGGRIYVWHRPRGDPVVLRTNSVVSELVCHPDRADFATVLTTGEIVVYSTAAQSTFDSVGRRLKIRDDFGTAARKLAYSSRGSFLAGASSTGTVSIWRTPGYSRMPVPTWTTAKQIAALVFSPDESRLAIAAYDGSVRVVRSGDGHLIDDFDFAGEVADLAFTRAASTLAVSGVVHAGAARFDRVRIRDLTTRSDITAFDLTGQPGRIVFAADDRLLVVATIGRSTGFPATLTAELWQTKDLLDAARRRASR